MKLFEAFEALDALNEETFTISDDGVEKLGTFMSDNNDVDDVVDVIDPEAETEEELKDSYVGKVILDCCVCHSKLYKDKEDVALDEEGTLANVGEDCPFCYTSDGFKVVGEVAPFEDSPSEEETVETEEEIKETEEVTESLTEAQAGTLERPMSKLTGTLGNVLEAHQNELAKLTSKKDALSFLEKIEPEVKNKSYLATVKEKVTKLPDFKVLTFLYNIILKGDGMGSKLESLVESHRGDRHRVTAELFDILSENGFDTDAEDVEDYVFAARDLVFEELLADPSKSIREIVEQWFKDTNVNYPEDLHSLTRLDEGIFDIFKKKGKKSNTKSSNSFVSASAGGLRKGDKVRIDSHLTVSSDEGDTLLIRKSNPHRNTIDKTFIEYENSFGQVHNAVLPDNLKVKKLSRGNNEALEEAANFRIGMFGDREWYDTLHKSSEDVINQKIDDLQARLKKLEGRDDWTDATEKTYHDLKWEIAEYEHELEQRKKSPEQKEQDAAKEKEIQLTNDQKRTLKYYRDEIEDYERKARTCIINGNRDGAEMWQDKIKRMKQLIAELTGKNESLDEGVFDVFKKKSKDTKGRETIQVSPAKLKKGDRIIINNKVARVAKVEASKDKGFIKVYYQINLFDPDLKVMNYDKVTKVKKVTNYGDYNESFDGLDEGILDMFSGKKKASDLLKTHKFFRVDAEDLHPGSWITGYSPERAKKGDVYFAKVVKVEPTKNGKIHLKCSADIDGGNGKESDVSRTTKYTVALKDRTKKESLEDFVNESNSIKEAINNLSLDTDDTHMEMTSDENGKVTISTEPIENTGVKSEETIVPVSPELEAEIVEEPVEEVPEGEEVEIEEFDEASFDELGESYLKSIYENVEAFKTTAVSTNDSTLFVEGLITFTSGNKGKTSFEFSAKDFLKEGIYRFIGSNKQLSEGKTNFELTGKITDKKFICESLTTKE